MAGEAANNRVFLLRETENVKVKIQADDERNVIQQVGELIGIKRCIRILLPKADFNGKAGKVVEEYNRKKKQLTEDPEDLVTLEAILNTYVDNEEGKRRPLVLMEVIHTF